MDRRSAIRRAAERAGITPAAEPPGRAFSFTPEAVEWCKASGLPLDATSWRHWQDEQLRKRPMTFTLGELCSAIGYDVEPTDFAATALERIGEQIEDMTDAVANGNGVGHVQWRNFNGIAKRAELAAKIQRKLAGVST